MPVFNQERYVLAAVASMLCQSFTDFELVVVDDGSTDDTLEVLSAVRDSRVRIVRAEHGGFLKALKRGIQESRGRWIARMDSDDVSDPTRLSRQMAFLDEHPECVYVASAYGIVTPNDKYLKPRLPMSWRYITARDITLATSLFADPSVVFDREKALDAGYDDEWENEKPLWYKMLRRGKAALLEEPLVYIRWRLGSHSRGLIHADGDVAKQMSANRQIRLKYDPENAEAVPDTNSDTEDVQAGRELRAFYIYCAAGDNRAMLDAAIRIWRRSPASLGSLKLLLNSIGIKRPKHVQGTSGIIFDPVPASW